MAEATVAQIRAEELINSLWNDANVGPAVRKTAKSKFPEIQIQDDLIEPVVRAVKDEAEQARNEIKALREERDAERKSAEEAKQRANLERSLDEARNKFGLTSEGFDAMVARMKETGNFTDAEAAAAWVASKTPPKQTAGPTWAPQSLNLFGSKDYDESLASLHRDPQGYMDRQLTEFVSDPDKYVADTFGRVA